MNSRNTTIVFCLLAVLFGGILTMILFSSINHAHHHDCPDLTSGNADCPSAFLAQLTARHSNILIELLIALPVAIFTLPFLLISFTLLLFFKRELFGKVGFFSPFTQIKSEIAYQTKHRLFSQVARSRIIPDAPIFLAFGAG
jgi:hypothetical protein